MMAQSLFCAAVMHLLESRAVSAGDSMKAMRGDAAAGARAGAYAFIFFVFDRLACKLDSRSMDSGEHGLPRLSFSPVWDSSDKIQGLGRVPSKKCERHRWVRSASLLDRR
jgi:hypothetical protein